jgi:tRNA (adenine22-N1)-methyltransferase
MQTEIAKTVIAADIGENPLKNAAKNIEAAGVSGIDLRLCDGLSGIKPHEVDTVIIAGIGGEVIANIIKNGANVTAREGISLILQPTTSPEILREFLYNNGYAIEAETPVFENDKIYSVMGVYFKNEPLKMKDSFYFIGKVSPKTEHGRKYIEKQYKRNQNCAIALENIEGKQTEYAYYKNIANDIEKLLK